MSTLAIKIICPMMDIHIQGSLPRHPPAGLPSRARASLDIGGYSNGIPWIFINWTSLNFTTAPVFKVRESLTVWLSVWSCHDNHTTIKQSSEERLQDHGVCYVRHLELVEAQQMWLFSNVVGHWSNGVVSVRLSSLTRTRRKLIFEAMDSWKQGKEVSKWFVN